MVSWTRRILELAALVLLVAAVTLAAVIVARGTPTVTAPVSPVVKAAMSSTASPAVKAQAALPCPPPPGTGVPGACAPKPVQVFGGRSAVPKVVPATVDPPACVPDVSSWQGAHIDWGAVKRWQLSRGCTPAGIFKMGEYVVDPDAYVNNAGLLANGMIRQGYWFIRKTGCIHEAQQIADEARFLKLSVVWLDDEVPEGYGYTSPGCITPTLKRAGITAVGIYASPGAFPGGSTQPLPAWIAAYGPANPPAAPWGGPIKGFQCTDGIFGCVTYIPGIGAGDVSVDYGLTKLGAGPTGPSAATVRKWIAIRGKSLHAYYVHGCRRPVLTSGVCGQLAWRVDHFQKLIDTAHGYYPHCFGKHADRNAAECRVVRPAVAVWSAARAATANAGPHYDCQGIATWGLPKSSPTCRALAQRYRYFDRRANHSVATSRY